MEKNKKLLLRSSILMILFLIPNIVISILFGIGTGFVRIYNISMYILSVLGISLFMYYSFSKKNINRGLEFFISIVFLFMNIVSGVLGFIYFSKTSKYKKRELPKLEIMHNHPKIIYILAFIISMVLMFVIPKFTESKIVSIAIDVVIVFMMILLFFKDLKRDFKYFKDYFREYNSYVLKMFGISFAVMVVLAISIRLYTKISSPTNQLNLIALFKAMPVYLILLACIYAPFTEELLFRGIFRKIFNNKWLFIILCGLTFGALHVIDDFQSIGELLYILVYSSLGMFLSATYYKTNNLFANIYFHFLQNTLAVIAIIVVSLLGI